MVVVKLEAAVAAAQKTVPAAMVGSSEKDHVTVVKSTVVVEERGRVGIV